MTYELPLVINPKVDHVWPRLSAEETPLEYSPASDLAPSYDLISKNILSAFIVAVLMLTLRHVPSAISTPKSLLRVRNPTPSPFRLTEQGLTGQSGSPHLSPAYLDL